MAAIRAGIMNQGLGQFHGGGYYRSSNYLNNNRYNPENEKGDSISESDSDISSQRSDRPKIQKSYFSMMMGIEKHRILRNKKKEHIEKLTKKLKIIDVFIVFLSSLGTILSNIEAEDFYNNDRQPTKHSNVYRSLVSISTFFSVILIVIHAGIDFSISKENREAAEEQTPDFFYSQNFVVLCVELTATIVHCPPGLNLTFVSNQLGGQLTMSLTELCAMWTLTRVYVVLKLIRHFSKWTNLKSRIVCEENYTEASTAFAIKSFLKERPFLLLTPLILGSIFIFSVAVRIVEREFYTGSQGQDYSYLWNAMWLVMLSMTTVGYGDFFPKTHIGRFIIILACLVGIFLISLMIVTMTNFILFTSEEGRSFDYMTKVKSLNTSKKYARLYIRSQLERYLYYKKNRKEFRLLKDAEDMNLMIKFYFKKFKEYEAEAKFANVGAEEMLTVLNERISLQVKRINQNLKVAHSVHENLTIAVAGQEKTKENLQKSIEYLQDLKKAFLN